MNKECWGFLLGLIGTGLLFATIGYALYTIFSSYDFLIKVQETWEIVSQAPMAVKLFIGGSVLILVGQRLSQ